MVSVAENKIWEWFCMFFKCSDKSGSLRGGVQHRNETLRLLTVSVSLSVCLCMYVCLSIYDWNPGTGDVKCVILNEPFPRHCTISFNT